MKTREEQIEEMAKAMCEEYDTDICKHECPMTTDCANILIAKRLIAAGYRKQSDTVREILQMIKDKGLLRYGGYLLHDSDFDTVGKLYGVEVKE